MANAPQVAFTNLADYDQIPTLRVNGLVRLVLEAQDSAGRDSREDVTLYITGEMKVGHLHFAVEELSVPVAGVPIRLLRSYDSRRRDQLGDFGCGWQLAHQDRLIETIYPDATPGDDSSVRQAKQYVKQSIKTPAKCKLNIPIQIIGIEIPETMVHIYQAQRGHGSTTQLAPAPFLLTYRGKGHPDSRRRRWLNRTDACPPSTRTKDGNWCDEYPYASVEEGGENWYPAWVSLRLIPGIEQHQQRNLLIAFYADPQCKLRLPGSSLRRKFIATTLPVVSDHKCDEVGR